jgi:hypothetical protein
MQTSAKCQKERAGFTPLSYRDVAPVYTSARLKPNLPPHAARVRRRRRAIDVRCRRLSGNFTVSTNSTLT